MYISATASTSLGGRKRDANSSSHSGYTKKELLRHFTENYSMSNDGTAAGREVDSLINEMTLSEKIGQMMQLPLDSFHEDEYETLFEEFGVGSIVLDGAESPITDPEALIDAINECQSYNLDHSSAGIPFVLGVDAIHGNTNVNDSIVYPHNCGVGATRDPDLVREYSSEVARSMQSCGFDWNFSPTADIQRDPRWGRYYEGFSEDPGLTGDLAVAKARGYKEEGIGTCLKHFVGYSLPENGNDRTSTNVSMRDFRTNVIPPYYRVLETDPDAVMVSSGAVNGVPAHGSSFLLSTVLRDRWGYDGLIMSDWMDFERMRVFHEYVPTYREAIACGISAGVDLVMNPIDPEQFFSETIALVKDGEIDEKRIDEAVSNVFELKAKLDLFEDPFADPAIAGEYVGTRRDLAETITGESMTLLKNDGDVLPFNDDISSILLTGPATDDERFQMGGWTLGWQSVGNRMDPETSPAATTIYEGLASVLGSNTELYHEPTGFEHEAWENYDHYFFENEDAVIEKIGRADAIVVTIGEGPYAEYYGDRDTLSLPETQRKIVDAISEACDDTTPIVGVVLAGRPRGGPDVFSQLDAALMAYLPGTTGGTVIADVLTGECNPSGRLPFTWPKSVGMVPEYYNNVPEIRDLSTRDSDDVFSRDPLFEFGHGLHYTEFEYREFDIVPTRISSPASQGTVTASVTIENAGETAGEHIVEVYAEESYGSVMHPKSRLLGYERVALDPGERTETEIRLPLERLEVVIGDLRGHGKKVVEEGEYRLSTGDLDSTLHVENTESISSADIM